MTPRCKSPHGSHNSQRPPPRAPLPPAPCTSKIHKIAVVNGKAVPLAEDIIHQRFLECVEKGDANAAMAHFAFIACEVRERGAAPEPRDAGAAKEAGELLTLRRRQLLVLLCEKGMVKEASELMTGAVGSPAFNSRDLSTIVSCAR